MIAALFLSGCEPGLTATESVVISLSGGQFRMGSSQDCTDATFGHSCKGDRVEHLVRVSQFELQATEVSRIQYASCVLTGKCPAQGAFDPGLKDLPVVVDDPDAARAYCATLGMRLPTEAEFEFAARVSMAGLEHVYPWGDDPPTCDRLNMAGCDDAFPLEVGSAPGDVTDRGIHDLAGSVPEWVEDRYHAYLGCLDRIGYADLCHGQGGNCRELRCAADEKYCARGCLPAAEDLEARGGQVTSDPVCPMERRGPESGGPVPVDPVERTASTFTVVRGGSRSDGACTLAGFTRRHAVPHRYLAGFRCARSTLLSVPPTPHAAYRFRLEGCPVGDAKARLSAATHVNPNASFHADWFPALGPMESADSMAGVIEGAPCEALFVVSAGPTPLTVSVLARGAAGCTAGQRSVDMTGGGDVPPVGVDTITLTAASCP